MLGDDAVTIDGGAGEGGGQILRTSVGLAAAVWGRPGQPGRSLRIVNIRANRPKPGLQAQHLAAVRAAAAVCGGTLAGDCLGSRELHFRPHGPRAGRYRFDVGTAGSSCLVLQTVLPALLAADGESAVTVTGGTHNPMAPCFEYLRDVFATLAEAAGASLALVLGRPGFYPAGGGEARAIVRGLGDPARLTGVRMLSRGELRQVEALSAVSAGLFDDIARRQAEQVARRLEALGVRHTVEPARWHTASPGAVVFVRAVFSRSVAGFFALGERGLRAEKVADQAVDQLLEMLSAGGAVDPHAADQLITLLALSPEASELTTTCVTPHLLTNAQVIRQVLGREVLVEGDPGRPGRVLIKPQQ